MASLPAASRRTLLCGAALAGTAGLAGCAGAEDSGADGPEKTPPTPTAPVELGPADAVPVGGAKLYREQRLLVSRPSPEEYRAFSAVCTHRQCVLSAIEGKDASCTCHGSRFDVGTGKVTKGPAVAQLPAVPVTAEGGKLVAG